MQNHKNRLGEEVNLFYFVIWKQAANNLQSLR